MSPALLAKPLRTLERAEVIERRPLPGGGHEYHPTRTGEELRPWIEAMGV